MAYRFIEAKHYTAAERGPGDITLIVLHTTEGPETPRRSEATAEMFHVGDASASAHYIVDPAEVTQAVRDKDVAWHAGHHDTNARSIGIEQNGKASQTAEEWDDDASTGELDLVAKLCGELCLRYSIPAVHLNDDELRAGANGFVGHDDITRVFNDGKGHHDPGPSYPWDDVLAMVQAVIDGGVLP